MCGIAGFFPCPETDKNLSILHSMSDALSHRGPDGEGVWCDGIIGLSHRRLSIFDLKSGFQPMHSRSKRFVISYNGEVYNFKAIRETLILKGIEFVTDTDTEVVLQSIEHWGLKKALSKFHGMFAFALWDTKQNLLTLVRDRMGEKPLYYGWHKDKFMFASELKAFKSHPEWSLSVDRNALSELLRYNYIPSPLTIYSGMKKLEPGSLITFNLNNNYLENSPEKWFNYSSIVNDPDAKYFSGSFDDATNSLDMLLNKTIMDQGQADVPLGVFLSGGLDSLLITSILQSQSSSPVDTFTMGYENPDYDESSSAKTYSKYLGTNHNEMIVTSADALSIIPSLCNIFDEPFADASQIPTILVSSLAKTKVKVVLSGDGADEIFGGYNRYLFSDSLNNFIKFSPSPVRKLISFILRAVSPSKWDKCFSMLKFIFPIKLGTSHPGEKIHKISILLSAKNEYELYSILVSMWLTHNPVLGITNNSRKVNNNIWLKDKSLAENMMNMDAVTYLPDDILTKVDRSSMSVGLETRAPFLDSDVVDFAARLPINYKINNNKGKILLRSVLDGYVPKKMHNINKRGFSAPIHEWLRGPLLEWSNDLLSESSLEKHGFFDVESIRKTWKDHLSEKYNNQYLLWSVLMFQSWMDNQN